MVVSMMLPMVVDTTAAAVVVSVTAAAVVVEVIAEAVVVSVMVSAVVVEVIVPALVVENALGPLSSAIQGTGRLAEPVYEAMLSRPSPVGDHRVGRVRRGSPSRWCW